MLFGKNQNLELLLLIVVFVLLFTDKFDADCNESNDQMLIIILVLVVIGCLKGKKACRIYEELE